LTPPYWQNSIGQYSLIEDYDRRNNMNACVSLFKKHMLSYVSYSFIKHHPEEEEPVGFKKKKKSLSACRTALKEFLPTSFIVLSGKMAVS